MAVYTTVKSLTDDLLAVTNTHGQVNTAHFGTITDLSNPKNATTPNYPYVFYIVDSISFTNAQYHVSITGIFMTQIEDTEDQMLQAFSDMTEIARDIFAYYSIQSGDSNPWGLARGSELQCTPFVERFQDTVSGVSVKFDFDIDIANQKCYFPVKP